MTLLGLSSWELFNCAIHKGIFSSFFNYLYFKHCWYPFLCFVTSWLIPSLCWQWGCKIWGKVEKLLFPLSTKYKDYWHCSARSFGYTSSSPFPISLCQKMAIFLNEYILWNTSQETLLVSIYQMSLDCEGEVWKFHFKWSHYIHYTSCFRF